MKLYDVTVNNGQPVKGCETREQALHVASTMIALGISDIAINGEAVPGCMNCNVELATVADADDDGLLLCSPCSDGRHVLPLELGTTTIIRPRFSAKKGYGREACEHCGDPSCYGTCQRNGAVGLFDETPSLEETARIQLGAGATEEQVKEFVAECKAYEPGGEKHHLVACCCAECGDELENDDDCLCSDCFHGETEELEANQAAPEEKPEPKVEAPKAGKYPYRGQVHRFPLSGYQERVIDFLLDGRGDAVVNAVAGSGKTSTLKAIAKYLEKPAIFLAFNKHIATELGDALQGTKAEVATIHSVGFRAIRRKLKGKLEVVPSKHQVIAKWLVDRAIAGKPIGAWTAHDQMTRDMLADEYPVRTIRELVRVLRVELRKWPRSSSHRFNFMRDLWPLCEKYDIDVADAAEEFIQHAVTRAMQIGFQLAQPRRSAPAKLDDLLDSFDAPRGAGLIDYTDMIWLPSQINAKPWQFPLTMVDECQDLSPAQLDVAMSCRYGRQSRMIFVGDRRQAIYGFAGASTDSVDNIVKATGATELPLSICYRCPSSHIEDAQEIVPEIEAAPWADEGVIGEVQRPELHEHVRETDIITCRTTAPLITCCFELLARGISAKVRGRDIGAQILTVLDDIEKRPGFKYDEIDKHLRAWQTKRTAKILRRNGQDTEDPAVQAIQDRVEAIQAFVDMSEAESLQQLRHAIEGLFSDERPSVWLATVHRVKGLEADRVFILHPELLPFPFAKQEWQREQEMNLKYVALTRAKKELYYIAEEK